MNKKDTITKCISLILNLFLFVSSIVICLHASIVGFSFGVTYYPGPNPDYFRYFTNLSNLFGGIVGIVIFIYTLKNFKKDIVLPKILRIIQLSASSATMLTFITVLTFLAPTYAMEGNNFWDMFASDMFFFHFFNPVVFYVSFLFFTKGDKLNFKEDIFGVFPMIIYASIYIPMILTNTWPDFYGFTFGGHYYLIGIVAVVMILITYLISFVISTIYNKIKKSS